MTTNFRDGQRKTSSSKIMILKVLLLTKKLEFFEKVIEKTKKKK